MTEVITAPPFPEPVWTSHRFLEDEAMEDQLRLYLSLMHAGMTDLGEVLQVATRLRSGDELGWMEAWSDLARSIEERAAAAEARGKAVSASTAYLRASTYWRASLLHFAYPADPRMQDNARASYRCHERYLRLSGYPGEYVEIPYESSFLPAYFYRSPVAGPKAPLLVFTQGRDAFPEDTRWVYDGAIQRGIHCLGVHGPGQGLAIRLNGLPFRPDWEQVITPAIDTALGLPGVDADRIALMGLSFGGHLAPRAAAFEPRVKICIANPGVLSWAEVIRNGLPPAVMEAYEAGPEVFNPTIAQAAQHNHMYDWWLRDSIWKHAVSTPHELLADLMRYDLDGVVDRITCETLVMDGTDERFSVGQAEKLYDALSCEKEYMLFDEASTGQLHCQNGATATAAERMFDWLDERI